MRAPDRLARAAGRLTVKGTAAPSALRRHRRAAAALIAAVVLTLVAAACSSGSNAIGRSSWPGGSASNGPLAFARSMRSHRRQVRPPTDARTC
jgi:hypothetical protein